MNTSKGGGMSIEAFEELVCSDDITFCPICGMPNEPIDQLGRLTHFCCQACGMWYSHDARED